MLTKEPSPAATKRDKDNGSGRERNDEPHQISAGFAQIRFRFRPRRIACCVPRCFRGLIEAGGEQGVGASERRKERVDQGCYRVCRSGKQCHRDPQMAAASAVKTSEEAGTARCGGEHRNGEDLTDKERQPWGQLVKVIPVWPERDVNQHVYDIYRDQHENPEADVSKEIKS